MNRADAEKINALVREIFERANDVLYVVSNGSDATIRGKAQRTLGIVTAELDLELLEPIYKQFPDLRPPDMPEVRP